MRATPRLLLLLVLAITAAPLAQAQIPGAPASCAIEVDPPATPAPVGVNEPAPLRVTVRNTGSLGASISVGATLSGDTRGWTLGAAPGAQTVASGQSADFDFTVVPGSEAGDQAVVNFVANAACTLAGGADCPGPIQQCAATDNTSAVATFDAPSGFRIPGLDELGFPLELLIAAIALVAIATAIPFLLKRRKRGVVAQCPEPLKMVRAGRGTSFPIELRNASDEPLTAAFDVSPVPEGWSAFMPLPEVQLAARETRSLWLMVRSPLGAPVGEAVDVELRLRTPGVADATSVRVRAEVQAGAEGA